MFILERPVVSNLLVESVVRLGEPVLDTLAVRELGAVKGMNVFSESTFLAVLQRQAHPKVYANSENAIGWMVKNLGFCSIPEKIALFKDKAAMRQLLAGYFPSLKDFRWKVVPYSELRKTDVSDMPRPFIAKPATGFMSIGVVRVCDGDDWGKAVDAIERSVQAHWGLFPPEVVSEARFLLEESVEGEEYAIDAYFDENGEPVILDILHHSFATQHDMSDRLYSTSPWLMKRWLAPFTEFLGRLGRAAGLRNFPMHMEVRVEEPDRIVPLEVNPMRFAGLCCTDIAHYAYGIDVYEHYARGMRPDWERILPKREGRTFHFVIADIPASIMRSRITGVKKDAYLGHFSKVHEARWFDPKLFPFFAILFIETPTDDVQEAQWALMKDTGEFLRV